MNFFLKKFDLLLFLMGLFYIVLYSSCNTCNDECSDADSVSIELEESRDAFDMLLMQEGEYEVNRNVKDFVDLCIRPSYIDIYKYKEENEQLNALVLQYSKSAGAICDSNIPDSNDKYCSGVLISESYFLTANHCVDKKSINDYVVFNYQYKDKDEIEEQDFYSIVRVVEEGRFHRLPMDYAILELEGKPGIKYEYVNISKDSLTKGDEIFIIQFPNGKPKKIALGIMSYYMNERINYTHTSTSQGSSGSCILDNYGRLVGVHTNGDCDKLFHGMNIVSMLNNSDSI